MPNAIQNPAALAARILLSLLFVMSGIGKIAGFDGTVGYIASTGLPMPAFLAVLTIVVEVGGGLLLLLGLFTRWSALALAGFALLSALIFHAYWSADAAHHMSQYINFWKNVTI
ncbi:MAG: DoxX family protein, partial [Caldimonas sp.]